LIDFIGPCAGPLASRLISCYHRRNGQHCPQILSGRSQHRRCVRLRKIIGSIVYDITTQEKSS